MFNIWKFQLKIIAGKHPPTDVFIFHCIVLNGRLYTKDLLPLRFSPPGNNYTGIIQQPSLLCITWLGRDREKVAPCGTESSKSFFTWMFNSYIHLTPITRLPTHNIAHLFLSHSQKFTRKTNLASASIWYSNWQCRGLWWSWCPAVERSKAGWLSYHWPLPGTVHSSDMFQYLCFGNGKHCMSYHQFNNYNNFKRNL